MTGKNTHRSTGSGQNDKLSIGSPIRSYLPTARPVFHLRLFEPGGYKRMHTDSTNIY